MFDVKNYFWVVVCLMEIKVYDESYILGIVKYVFYIFDW